MGRLRFPLESNDSVNGQSRRFYFVGVLSFHLLPTLFSLTHVYKHELTAVQEGRSFRLRILGI